MLIWQQVIISIFACFSFIIWLIGLYRSSQQQKAYQDTWLLYWMGIFVWGDAVWFGLFWLLAGLFCLLISDWLLFLLIWSVFWLIRSAGETIYWFNQQFSNIKREPPEDLPLFNLFKNDAVWFGYQTFHQCLTIVSLITTIYLAALWLAAVL